MIRLAFVVLSVIHGLISSLALASILLVLLSRPQLLERECAFALLGISGGKSCLLKVMEAEAAVNPIINALQKAQSNAR